MNPDTATPLHPADPHKAGVRAGKAPEPIGRRRHEDRP